MKVLVLGQGLLGKELVSQTGWHYVSRKEHGFDITKHIPSSVLAEYDTIVNCIANTDTYSKDRQSHWDINYKAVSDLVLYCNVMGQKLVHISTDYIYANSEPHANEETTVPVHANNWYSYTKLLGDAHVQLQSKNYLIVRCSHKPKPFPYDKVWIDQWGNFDYVDVIARLIEKLILSGANGVYNVGTELKNMYTLAKQTATVGRMDIPEHVPNDISMDLTKLENTIHKHYDNGDVL